MIPPKGTIPKKLKCPRCKNIDKEKIDRFAVRKEPGERVQAYCRLCSCFWNIGKLSENFKVIPGGGLKVEEKRTY